MKEPLISGKTIRMPMSGRGPDGGLSPQRSLKTCAGRKP
nr:MAG TPA: hypothetical protein [Caudoviricetes sp.]